MPLSQLITDMKLAGLTEVGQPDVLTVDQDTLDDIREHFGASTDDSSLQVTKYVLILPYFINVEYS